MVSAEIKLYEGYNESEILSLYQSVGWSAYYSQPEVLRQAFSKSLCVIGAYVSEELVGLARLVGDGATVIFLQDILIKPAYQRQGIGTRLIAEVFRRYGHVRQIHLMTDDVPETVGFYQSVGFTSVEKLHFRAFTKLRY